MKSKGTYHKMLSEYKQSQKNGESPELFRLKAKMRMNSSSKKFALVIDEAMNLVNADQMNMSSSLKKSMRQKKALIALSNEQAEATKDMVFVNPNSKAYANVVLEDKINTHQKKRSNKKISIFGGAGNDANASMRLEDYNGSYSFRRSP